MSRTLATIFFLFFAFPAQAQSHRISGAEIVKAGYMKADVKPKVDKRDSISTGQMVNYDEDPKVYDQATRIAVTGPTIFGVEVRLRGRPDGANANLTVVWLYPEPGIVSPQTNKPRFKDSYSATQRIGAIASYYWTLDEGFAKVPGTWTFKLWDGERRLVKQEFTMLP